MSTITAKDLEKVKEPCKSCKLSAYGRGKNKEIFCARETAKLMGEGNPFWYQLPDCPLRTRK